MVTPEERRNSPIFRRQNLWKRPELLRRAALEAADRIVAAQGTRHCFLSSCRRKYPSIAVFADRYGLSRSEEDDWRYLGEYEGGGNRDAIVARLRVQMGVIVGEILYG